MKRTASVLAALLMAAVLAACGQPLPTAQSIGQILAASDDHETLRSLLPADLTATFADGSAGPYTLSAPTDAAFDAIAALLPTLSDAEVLEVLNLHVVEGRRLVDDAAGDYWARSLGGEVVYFEDDGGALLVDGVATVVTSDRQASNGVVHFIDTVLLPKGTIADRVEGGTDPQLQTLWTALQAAEASILAALDDVDAGPFTLFAPNDAAFAALGGTLDALLADQAALSDVLRYHATSETAYLALRLDERADGGDLSIGMLNGQEVTLGLDGETLTVDGARLVVVDILTANGVVHVIDEVLLPVVP